MKSNGGPQVRTAVDNQKRNHKKYRGPRLRSPANKKEFFQKGGLSE